MNLTYVNVTLTGKVQRWKLYLQDKDFYLCHVPRKEVQQLVPDALSCLCDNHMPVKESENLLTSGIKLSWPLLSQNIAFPTQSFDRLLRCTTPWLATGA